MIPLAQKIDNVKTEFAELVEDLSRRELEHLLMSSEDPQLNLFQWFLE